MSMAGPLRRAGALLLAVAVATVLAMGPAHADSAAARCELVPAGQRLPTAVRACQFSQRQGTIGVQLADDERHDFSPLGSAPGAYTDAQGRAVSRIAGQGRRGQQFRLADGRLLRVLWGSAPLDSTLALQGIRFRLQSANAGSVNTLTLTPAGLLIDNRPQRGPIDGTVSSAEVADLDHDGSPELYIGITSAGSGSAGELLGFAVNRRKSLSFVAMPALEAAAPEVQGYMGHDRFAVEGDRLVRRFPVYLPGDANAAPSGGSRALFYRLAPGEAGCQLVLDSQADLPPATPTRR
jgi:hypothetical protein